MSIETTMTEMPEIWDQYDFQEKHFTIGNGKKPYHFWTWGPCGLCYAYRCMESGHAGCKRAVEPSQKVFIHIN